MSVCVALFIQDATRMRHIIFSFAACMAVPYFFFTLFHKRRDFRKKKKLLNIKRVFRFSLKTNV